MKKTHIIILIGIAALIVALLAYSVDFSTYDTVASAKQKQGKFVHLIAKVDKTQPIEYDPINNPNYLSFVEFFCSPKAVEGIYKPIIADWRNECFNALEHGRKWKARWISVRYNCRFIQALGLNKLLSLVRIFRSIRK